MTATETIELIRTMNVIEYAVYVSEKYKKCKQDLLIIDLLQHYKLDY